MATNLGNLFNSWYAVKKDRFDAISKNKKLEEKIDKEVLERDAKKSVEKDLEALFKKNDARGLVVPGYKYLGPFNGLDKGKPVNDVDAAAEHHDKDYNQYIKEGKNPYLSWNKADEEFLDALAVKPKTVAGNAAAGIFGLKKKLQPVMSDDDLHQHVNKARKGGAGEGTSGEKTPTNIEKPSTGQRKPPARRLEFPAPNLGSDLDLSSAESDLSSAGPSSVEMGDAGGDGGGGGGGGSGGGPAGVVKPPLRNEYHWLEGGKYLHCIATRRFQFSNQKAYDQPSVDVFKGTKIVATVPTSAARSSQSTEVIVPTRGKSTTEVLAPEDIHETESAPPKKRRGDPDPTQFVRNTDMVIDMYSAKYDWYYVDWNRRAGIMQPSALQQLMRNVAQYRVVGLKIKYHGLQCMNEQTVGGGQMWSLMPYSAAEMAIRNRKQINWVTTGRRMTNQGSGTFGPEWHWPKDPTPAVADMWNLHLNSSLYPNPVAEGGAASRWNMPLMEDGEIEFMTQVDEKSFMYAVQSSWIKNDTYTEHVLDCGLVGTELNSSTDVEYWMLTQNVSAPFLAGRAMYGTHVLDRTNLTQPWYQSAAGQPVTRGFNTLSTGVYAKDVNPLSGLRYSHHVARSGVRDPAGQQFQSDYDGSAVGRVGNTDIRDVNLDVPIFVVAPEDSDVRATQWCVPVINGDIPDQVFFRCQPVLVPGGQLKMHCSIYCTVEVMYECVSHEAVDQKVGWSGYQVPEIGVGGVDLDASVAASELRMRQQTYVPAQTTNAWNYGAQKRLY